MGMGQGLSEVLCTKDILAGQLKLKWVHTCVSQDAQFSEHPGKGAAAKVGCPGVLCTGDTLVSYLECAGVHGARVTLAR